MTDEESHKCEVCKSETHTSLYCPYMELIASCILVFTCIVIFNNYRTDNQLVIKAATGYLMFSSIFNIAEFLIELINAKIRK